MKIVVGLVGAALLLGVTGCEVSGGYGGVYGGVSGEYPSTYYGSGAYPGYVGPGPVYVSPYVYGVPYDRDHYWDRGHHWQHRDRDRHHH